MAENAPAQVDFWFDPICPWCWITSRWIGEVQKVRNIEVTWRPFSLSMHNQGRDLPADYQAAMDRSWAPTRLITAVRELHGNEVINPSTTLWASRFTTTTTRQIPTATQSSRRWKRSTCPQSWRMWPSPTSTTSRCALLWTSP